MATRASSPADLAAFRTACAEGDAHAHARRWPQAAAAFGRATRIAPGVAGAWRALGNVHHASGDRAAANAAHLRALAAGAGDPALADAERALKADRLAEAHAFAVARLKADRTDLAALRLMAELAMRAGRPEDAVTMLTGALELAPGFDAAWRTLAVALRQLPIARALAIVRERRAARPDVDSWQGLEGTFLEQSGDYDGAIAAFEALLARHPEQPAVLLALGQALRTLGRTEDAIEAYRRAIAAAPRSGEGWAALADLKPYRFDAGEVARMRALAATPDLPDGERAAVAFALARAAETAGDAEAAFGHYAEGNRLKARTIRYDRDEIERDRDAMQRVFTPALFAARGNDGCPAPDPIFIVGLPRSGSTLVEQILASHPQVEATRELIDLNEMVRQLMLTAPGQGRRFPDLLATVPADELRALGQAFLDRVRGHRHSGRPFFVDKMPINFLHVGLIRLILPNARVIDVRREARASGFSIFKQMFARGYHYAWSLEDIAAHRASYLRVMALWDAVLPGFVHHLGYEALIGDVEGEVRRLLDHCGLPFDPACLRFHETDRPVRTPSGEQVRRPVSAAGLDGWRAYARWLGPLAGEDADARALSGQTAEGAGAG